MGGEAAGAGGAGGSGGGEPEVLCRPGLPTVSFATDVQPILTTSCAKANCHAGTNPDAGLDLREGAAYAELVNTSSTQCFGERTRVTPGDPEESYLFDKIRNKDLCGNSKRMPYPPTAMLPDEQRTLIEAWICAGALED